jgi:hypothetical protein
MLCSKSATACTRSQAVRDWMACAWAVAFLSSATSLEERRDVLGRSGTPGCAVAFDFQVVTVIHSTRMDEVATRKNEGGENKGVG